MDEVKLKQLAKRVERGSELVTNIKDTLVSIGQMKELLKKDLHDIDSTIRVDWVDSGSEAVFVRSTDREDLEAVLDMFENRFIRHRKELEEL